MDSINVNTHPTSHYKHSKEISYRKVLRIILSRWYWLLYTTGFALIIASLYLSYKSPIYATKASLKFEEKRSEISEIMNVRSVYDRSDKLLSEQFVIRSREVLWNAINNLNYTISFYREDPFRSLELYPLVPLNIQIIAKDKENRNIQDFQFTPTSTHTFTLIYTQDERQVKRSYKIGDIISVHNLQFKITGYRDTKQIVDFHFNTPDELLSRVDVGLKMNENKNTNILTFNQIDHNAVFAQDILNSILDEYVSYDRNQKAKSASQTIAFIEGLQADMAAVVKLSSNNFERFKVRSQMLDIPGTTKKVTGQIERFENEKSRIKLEGLMIAQLEKDIRSDKNTNSINYNLQGTADPLLSGLLSQYNALLVTKQEQLITYKPSASSIQEIDKQLLQVKSSIISNVSAQAQKNHQAAKFLDQQAAQVAGSFNQIPKAEKEYINLQSDFDVNQKVYAYLSEKKLEAQISKAAITPGVIIVDRATLNATPLSPLPEKTYTTAILLGVLSGIGLIFLIRLVNPYLHDVESISLITRTPIIGVLRKLPKSNFVIGSTLRQIVDFKTSIFYESVRAVRTSISFLAPEKTCKVICLSSENSKEGKSFTAMELANSLCLIDKKVLLIAADLRKSRLHFTFNLSNETGLSSYLMGKASQDDIIYPTEVKDFHIIPAGPTPPNPSELLHSFRMKELIAELRSQYDYVIIDSAPIGLVSDAMPVIRQSDINLFIIRAGVSRYSAALIPDALTREFGLTNVGIILNAYDNNLLYSDCYKGPVSKSGYYNPDQSRQYYAQGYFNN